MGLNNPSDKSKTIKEAVTDATAQLWDTSNFFTYCELKNVVIPNECILDKYKSIFSQLLSTETLDTKYHYNPGLYAYDKYGSQNLDFLVMYFSGMYSVLDFNQTTISYLPEKYLSSIHKILRERKTEVSESKNDPVVYDDLTIYEL